MEKKVEVTDKIVVLSTCPDEASAVRLARHLVERRLAACVNLVPGVRSIYHWKGALEESQEVLLVIKTRRDVFSALEKELTAIHSYEVPEVIALPIVEGSRNYLAWLERDLPAEGEAV